MLAKCREFGFGKARYPTLSSIEKEHPGLVDIVSETLLTQGGPNAAAARAQLSAVLREQSGGESDENDDDEAEGDAEAEWEFVEVLGSDGGEDIPFSSSIAGGDVNGDMLAAEQALEEQAEAVAAEVVAYLQLAAGRFVDYAARAIDLRVVVQLLKSVKDTVLPDLLSTLQRGGTSSSSSNSSGGGAGAGVDEGVEWSTIQELMAEDANVKEKRKEIIRRARVLTNIQFDLTQI